MSPLQLQRLVEFLSRYYHFISLDEAVDMLTGKIPFKAYSIVLTFDDGYRNNLTHAGPVLLPENIPYTIYLTAGLIEKRKPMWVDQLDYALQNYLGDSITCQIQDQRIELAGGSFSEKANSFKAFRRAAKAINCSDTTFQEAMYRTAQELESNNELKFQDIWETDDWSVLLSWEDINGSDQDLITYGGHTNNHIRLAQVPNSVVEKELSTSKSLIENRIGRVCHHFAYPDDSYNDTVVKLVNRCGYKSAVTAHDGFNYLGADIYKLNRIMVPLVCDEADILARVSGFLAALSRIKKIFNLA